MSNMGLPKANAPNSPGTKKAGGCTICVVWGTDQGEYRTHECPTEDQWDAGKLRSFDCHMLNPINPIY